jgi:hypothetical protein
MVIKVFVGLLGLFFVLLGYFYNTEFHEKKFASMFSDSTAGGGSGIETIILQLVGVILSLLPWYVIKGVFFLIGLIFLYVAVNL